MNNKQDKFLSQLGLCKRAGKLMLGEDATLIALRDKSAKLVILSEDASELTAKKIKDKCLHYHVPLIQRFDRYTLGGCVGQEARVVLVVIDKGFARMLQQSTEIPTEVAED